MSFAKICVIHITLSMRSFINTINDKYSHYFFIGSDKLFLSSVIKNSLIWSRRDGLMPFSRVLELREQEQP